jgi:hypothetical protein
MVMGCGLGVFRSIRFRNNLTANRAGGERPNRARSTENAGFARRNRRNGDTAKNGLVLQR